MNECSGVSLGCDNYDKSVIS